MYVNLIVCGNGQVWSDLLTSRPNEVSGKVYKIGSNFSTGAELPHYTIARSGAYMFIKDNLTAC